MTISYWVILIVSVLVGAIVLETYLKRGRRSKPMHEKFNPTETSKKPLGMEAKGKATTYRWQPDSEYKMTNQSINEGNKTFIKTSIRTKNPQAHAKYFAPKDKKQ